MTTFKKPGYFVAEEDLKGYKILNRFDITSFGANWVLAEITIPKGTRYYISKEETFPTLNCYQKCRAEKVVVTKMIDLHTGSELNECFHFIFRQADPSNLDFFNYKLGLIEVSKFEYVKEEACAAGIHFFFNKEEIVNFLYDSGWTCYRHNSEEFLAKYENTKTTTN